MCKQYFLKESLEHLSPILVQETDTESTYSVVSSFKGDIPPNTTVQVPETQLVDCDRALYVLNLRVGALLNFVENRGVND